MAVRDLHDGPFDIRDSLQTRGGDADPSAPTSDEDAGAIITDPTTRIVKAQELLAEAERLIDRADRLLNTSETSLQHLLHSYNALDDNGPS